MNSIQSLKDISDFFRSITAPQALMTLYLVNKFEGVFISDLAQAVDVSQAQMTNLCLKLKRVGAIQKESVTRSGGRIVMVRIDKEAKSLLSPFFALIRKDPEIIAAVDKYQHLKDTKQLVSDRYGV